MKKKIILGITACFILLLGGLIYLCFRPPSVLFFRWLDLFGIKYFVFQHIGIKLPSLIINNFSNALFVLFGYIFVYIIWSKDKYHYFLYTSIITFLNITYEIISYDISDIVTILITFIIFSLFYLSLYGVKYEKYS